jgi:hypothetical protein
MHSILREWPGDVNASNVGMYSGFTCKRSARSKYRNA